MLSVNLDMQLVRLCSDPNYLSYFVMMQDLDLSRGGPFLHHASLTAMRGQKLSRQRSHSRHLSQKMLPFKRKHRSDGRV